MKRFVFAALLFVVVECLLSPSLAHAEERAVSQPPQLVIKSVTAGLSGRANYEYVELYNPNIQDIILDSWIFTHLRKEGSETQSFTLHGTISAKSSVLFAGSDTELTALPPDFSLKESSIVTTGGIVRIVDNRQLLVDELRWGDTGVGGGVWPLSTGTTLQRRFVDGVPLVTGDTKQDFQVVQATINTPGSGGYVPYSAPIITCDGVIISEIGANVSTDRQFIELYNESEGLVPLDGCLLQTNRSLTKSYTLAGTLASGEYHAYYVADMDLQLTKTTSGSVYLLASDGKSETDVRSYDSLPEGASWARYGRDDWRQTFAPTPSAANVWQEFLPCEAGYERSADTNRCRKVVSETVVSECEVGKYRSPETGRCRAVENAPATQLAPCAADQYRNPDTNRCRSTGSLVAEPAACKEGQERNPETNRCHAATAAIPVSDFPVEPVQEAGKTFVGWWVLGGVGSMGLAYAGWEWRREAAELIKRASSVFGLGK